MEPKYDNAKKLYAGREAGGKEVHAIRIIGSSTGALACLASGQIDVVQYVAIATFSIHDDL
jgi:fructose-1,6-bisphosphatase/inositol monophosphatase family enzyme